MKEKKQAIIEVKNLTKKFKNKIILDNLSFKVYKGEIFGIIGPNGAGKTVLLNTLLGLISPDSGQIKILDLDLERKLREIRSKINFASSYTQLPPDLDIISNLRVFATLYGVSGSFAKIKNLINFFNLKELTESKRPLSFFSSGENARVSLIKSLITDPEILLLDEATASLDNESAKKLINLLKQENKKRNLTIVYTTHRLEELKYFDGTICKLEKGQIKSIKRGKNES